MEKKEVEQLKFRGAVKRVLVLVIEVSSILAPIVLHNTFEVLSIRPRIS